MEPLSPTAAPRPEVAILANPKAGRGGAAGHLDELVEALRRQGLERAVCWQREAFTELTRADRDTLRCIVAAGGDGTLNEMLNRAPGIPASVLPLGNENLVARHFRLERSGEKLAQAIVAGRQRQLDLGRAGERLFTLMAGIGIDAEVVHAVHQARSGHVNKLSYVGPTLSALTSYPFPAIEVEIVETGERLRGTTAFVFNLPQYALGLPIGRGARADDGRLDLYVFQRPGIGNLVRYLAAVAGRRHERLPDVQHRRVEQVRCWSEGRVPVQVDGDPAGQLPMTIAVVPGAWRLIVP
jgi:diacylglycerol kinase family enzyme